MNNKPTWRCLIPSVVRSYFLSKLSLPFMALITSAIFLSIGFSGCSTVEQYFANTEIDIPTPEVFIKPQDDVDVTFTVVIPENTPEDEQVILNILDEVTGLALNVESHPMILEAERTFSVTIPIKLGSVIKYRYSRETASTPMEEHTYDGRQVRYRLFKVQHQSSVVDQISRWTDTNFYGPTGRIMGQVSNNQTGQPIPNLLVAAGGMQVYTSADGAYLIEGLPPGIHNLAVYAIDGSYRTFQQGAIVAPDSTTPASFSLEPTELVDITFDVHAPDNTVPAIPIHLAGNLYQTGNTFADMSSGVSTIASRMPTLDVFPDFRYSTTLQMPVGAHFRYLYTLGDGLWNAEKSAEGMVVVRDLIIPDEDTTISDTIENWYENSQAPLSFDINIPSSTIADDSLSIQFNPLIGWTEPVPLWRLSETRWVYVLNSPLHILDSLRYRICRNDQCGSADDLFTAGPNHPGRGLPSADTPQTVQVQIDDWAWLDTPLQDTITAPETIIPRDDSFIAGFEMLAAYHPSWNKRIPLAINAISNSGANWITVSPTWSVTRSSLPILEQIPGTDPFWLDTEQQIITSQSNQLAIGLKPALNFSINQDRWWLEAARDYAWWQVWFEQYRNFLLHHATMASRYNLDAIIIDSKPITPALPDGTLADGTPSGVPADAQQRWDALLDEVRNRFDGQMIWSTDYSQFVNGAYMDLTQFDQLEITINEPLTNNNEPLQTDLEVEITRLLDDGVYPIIAEKPMPILLRIDYPSADGAATACLPDPEGGCLDFERLSQPNEDTVSINRDLQEQTDIYNAFLYIVNQRDWIMGVISADYYPPAALQDKSASVHGKLAEIALTTWYKGWLLDQ